MNKDFNAELLAAYLISKRGKTKQPAFAKKIGIRRSLLIDLENQNLEAYGVDLDGYIKICKFLNVSLDTFIPKKISSPFRKRNHNDKNDKILNAFEAIASTLSRMDNRADQLQKGLSASLYSIISSEEYKTQPPTFRNAISEFVKHTK